MKARWIVVVWMIACGSRTSDQPTAVGSAAPAPAPAKSAAPATPVEMKPDDCPKRLACDKLFPDALRARMFPGMKITEDRDRVECDVDVPGPGRVNVRVMPGKVPVTVPKEWFERSKPDEPKPVRGIGRYAVVLEPNNIFMLPTELDCTIRVIWEDDFAKATDLARAVDATVTAAAQE